MRSNVWRRGGVGSLIFSKVMPPSGDGAADQGGEVAQEAAEAVELVAVRAHVNGGLGVGEGGVAGRGAGFPWLGQLVSVGERGEGVAQVCQVR